MFRFVFTALFLLGLSSQLLADALIPYEDARETAIREHKPLVTSVACPCPDVPGAIHSRVKNLDGYEPGDVVVSAPEGEKLFWVKTYRLGETVTVPKRVPFGCESGKCRYTYFPKPLASIGTCSGPFCSGPTSCGTGGNCAECSSCNANSGARTIRYQRMPVGAGSCPTCPR